MGYLIERKGHHLIIEALQSLPDVHLYIAGDGPDKKTLALKAKEFGVTKQVSFMGSLSQDELRKYYGATDLLVLGSSREGWANVLLEAMACGTPVVATDVWGTPEVVKPESGGLLTKRTAVDIRNTVHTLLTTPPSRQQTRKYAENFSWDATSEGLHSLFTGILEKS